MSLPAPFLLISPHWLRRDLSLSDQIPNSWVAKWGEMQNDLPNGYEVFRQQKGHANAHETVYVQVRKPRHTAQRQRKNTEKNVKIL